jgi:hypothetical protein
MLFERLLRVKDIRWKADGKQRRESVFCRAVGPFIKKILILNLILNRRRGFKALVFKQEERS